MRGAWIEITLLAMLLLIVASLPMRGAWIEIIVVSIVNAFCTRRSPCGERGLKFANRQQSKQFAASLPMRGAWIEIILLVAFLSILVSLPMRGAWIEITVASVIRILLIVAPHAGSVD